MYEYIYRGRDFVVLKKILRRLKGGVIEIGRILRLAGFLKEI